MKIAVYGTLRGKVRGELLSTERLEGWQMLTNGYFPTVIPSVMSNGITVEVYDVKEDKELERLDAYEGFPNYYTKVIIPTKLGNAQMYMCCNLDEFGQTGVVESGNWEDAV